MLKRHNRIAMGGNYMCVNMQFLERRKNYAKEKILFKITQKHMNISSIREFGVEIKTDKKNRNTHPNGI